MNRICIAVQCSKAGELVSKTDWLGSIPRGCAIFSLLDTPQALGQGYKCWLRSRKGEGAFSDAFDKPDAHLKSSDGDPSVRTTTLKSGEALRAGKINQSDLNLPRPFSPKFSPKFFEFSPKVKGWLYHAKDFHYHFHPCSHHATYSRDM